MSGKTDTPAAPATSDTLTKQKQNSKEIDKFWKEEAEREWNRREQSRRVDAEYVARRQPYNDTPQRGWWQ